MNKKYKIILKNNQPFLWSALMSVLKDNRSRLKIYISHTPLCGPTNIIIIITIIIKGQLGIR